MNATMDQVVVTDKNATEDRRHQWVAEASEIGLLPGEWPQRLETTLGNKRPFVRAGGGSEAVVYAQEFGALWLTVFND